MCADFSSANLRGCDLTCANLMEANLNGADLDGTNLFCANFTTATLVGSKIRSARLLGAVLVEANLASADLSGSWVYGVSAWNAKLDGTIQSGLIVTGPGEPEVTVDHLEMAQFVDLLLHNANIRNALDTLTSKIVLILGRFTTERKEVLDALRAALRLRDCVPVIFDFEKPGQTTVETISTLAHMARYVLADVSDPKSVLQELQAIVPNCPTVAVQVLLLQGQELPPMFDAFRNSSNVIKPAARYHDKEDLLSKLDQIVARAEAKSKELNQPAEEF